MNHVIRLVVAQHIPQIVLRPKDHLVGKRPRHDDCIGAAQSNRGSSERFIRQVDKIHGVDIDVRGWKNLKSIPLLSLSIKQPRKKSIRIDIKDRGGFASADIVRYFPDRLPGIGGREKFGLGDLEHSQAIEIGKNDPPD
jgi:hypothetical protein